LEDIVINPTKLTEFQKREEQYTRGASHRNFAERQLRRKDVFARYLSFPRTMPNSFARVKPISSGDIIS
jgi:hypothetical protein